MIITVEYMAQIKQAAGLASEQVELDGPCQVSDLIARLVQRHGESFQRLLLDPNGRLQPSILLFVGDEQLWQEDQRELRDGDVITFLSPIGGG